MLFRSNKTNPNQSKSIPMKLLNNLWYIQQNYMAMAKRANSTSIHYFSEHTTCMPTIVHRLSKTTEYELWHQRCMHAGNTCFANLDKCTHGVPTLKQHDFHSCHICKEMNVKKTSNKTLVETQVTAFGQRFQMDFGFMKARSENRNIRSHDGYNCYLLIVDFHTRYSWVFLCKNKNPPVQTVKHFLISYGITGPNRII